MGQNEVIVVTETTSWDCIMGVFTGYEALLNSWLNQEREPPLESYEELEKVLMAEGYHIHHEQLDYYPVL